MVSAAAALLLLGLSISTARAETAVPKRSPYPQLPDPSTRDGPRMTVDEQQKLKNELTNTRDRQSSQAKLKMGRCDLNPKSLEEATSCADREERGGFGPGEGRIKSRPAGTPTSAGFCAIAPLLGWFQ
jgi:hypothetical protein